VKAISLWQPWATLMAVRLKKNETRHWATSYRGRILIHATKRMEPPTILMRELLKPHGYQSWDDFPRGALVCAVDIIDCISTNNYEQEYPECQFGDYSPNRFVFVTDNLQTFKDPIPFRGIQGKFLEVPDKIIINQHGNEIATKRIECEAKQLKLFR